VLDWAAAEGLGFSHVVGVGGNANVGFATTLDWLARDPGTGAVLLDMRLIRNRRGFVSAARAVARTRPVVALRAGGRGAGGSGVGEAVMDAALRRAGVLRVSGLEDLLAAAETLARVRVRSTDLRHGNRVALVSNGAGIARIGSDALIGGGGRLAELTPAARESLQVHLPDAEPASNPLSLGAAAGTRLAEAAALLAVAPEVDAVVALHAPTPHGDDAAAAEAMIAAASVRRGRAAPVLIAWTGQETAAPQRQAMTRAGLTVFATPEGAVRGACTSRRTGATAPPPRSCRRATCST
jgi:acetyltransferase